MSRNAARQGGAISYLSDHAIDQAISIKYELGFVAEPLPGDERFRGMLSIPYLTPSGPVAIKFRALTDSGAKYAQSQGQEGRLYNTAAYFEAGTTIGISEGEMDAIAATEHLGVPTLGVPGAKAWKDKWTILFKDFLQVFVFADGDAEDSEAWQFPLTVAAAIGWRAKIIRCPQTEDVSSMCGQGRQGELLSLMSTSNLDE